MKHKKLKKLCAFFITLMLFSCSILFAKAQKTSAYLCKCGARQYGCSPTNSGCVAACASRCRITDSVAEKSLNDSLFAISADTAFTPKINIAPGNDPSTLFYPTENAAGYSCNCFIRGYGCPRFDTKCVGICGAKCGRLSDKEKKTSITLDQDNNSSPVFENESPFIKLNDNPLNYPLIKWNWNLPSEL